MYKKYDNQYITNYRKIKKKYYVPKIKLIFNLKQLSKLAMFKHLKKLFQFIVIII